MRLKTEWRSVGSSVSENIFGDRIHLSGRIGIKSNQSELVKSNIDAWEKIKERHFCLRVMGGNNKRGLMLMAERMRDNLTKQKHETYESK